MDPRVELLSIIFYLAGNPEYGKGKVASYKEDVDRHLGPFREHSVVQLARQLRRTRGVSYDACMSMAVHVDGVDALEERISFDDSGKHLDARWRVDEARRFLAATREFVKESSFNAFFERHQKLYRTTESRMRAVLQKHFHCEWFDQFFGARPEASFTVVLGLLNGGGSYGPRCRRADGKEELFCILGVWRADKDGVPRFDRSMIDTVVHEFCHSYANPVIEKIAQELEPAGKSLFPRAAKIMKRQAYGNWKTMFYESLVRACVVRYTTRHRGLVLGLLVGQTEKLKGFLWVAELAQLLDVYEKHRDRYPTLDAFAPRLVAFFNDYAKKLEEAQASPPGKSEEE